MGYGRAELLCLLRDYAEENGNPGYVEVNTTDSLPSGDTYSRYFGTFNEAKRLLGLETDSPPQLLRNRHEQAGATRENLISLLQEYAESNGSPGYDECREADELPAPSTFQRHFGGFNEAKEAAGLSSRTPSKQASIPTNPLDRSTFARGYVRGVLYGDGSLVGTQLQMSVTDEDFAAEFARQYESWTGLEMNRAVYEKNINESGYSDSPVTIYVSRRKSKPVAEFLRSLPASEWAEWISDASTEEQRGMLRGLFDSDGYVSRREDRGDNIGFSNSKDYHAALWDFLSDSVLTDSVCWNSWSDSNPMWTLTLSTPTSREFMEHVGTGVDRKRESYDPAH